MTDLALRYLWQHAPVLVLVGLGALLIGLGLASWWLSARTGNRLIGIGCAIAGAHVLTTLYERARVRYARPQGEAVLNDVETTEEGDE